MKVIVLQSSPNRDGLTAACAAAAVEGARAAGAEVEDVRINDLKIARCNCCGNGWGGCSVNHECGGVQEAFQALHNKVNVADALVFVTPVYWGQPSESAQAFMDRFRRCEATRGDASAMAGKYVLCVGAAGGSGNGTMTCLGEMERWCQHIRAERWDLIPITRRSRSYKVDTIREAGEALVRENQK